MGVRASSSRVGIWINNFFRDSRQNPDGAGVAARGYVGVAAKYCEIRSWERWIGVAEATPLWFQACREIGAQSQLCALCILSQGCSSHGNVFFWFRTVEN